MIIVEFQHKHMLYTHPHITLCENDLGVIKIKDMSCSLGQIQNKSWNQTSGDTARCLKWFSSTYQCFQSKTSRNLQRSFQLTSLTLLQNCFSLKQFQIIIVRMFHERSSNIKLQWKPSFQAWFVTFAFRLLCGPTQRHFQAPSSAESHRMDLQGPVTQKVLGLPAAKIQTPRSSKVSKVLAQFQPGQTKARGSHSIQVPRFLGQLWFLGTPVPLHSGISGNPRPAAQGQLVRLAVSEPGLHFLSQIIINNKSWSNWNFI